MYQPINPKPNSMQNRRKYEDPPAARHRPSFTLLITTLLLVCLGLVMLYSASSIYALMLQRGDTLYYFKRQLISFGIGLVGMLAFMNTYYRRLFKLAPLMFLGSIFLLLLTFVIGVNIAGAKRWIMLGPFSIQPSEIVIIAVIIYISFLFSRSWGTERMKEEYARALLVIGISFGTILLQRDLGTGAMLLLPSLAIVFAAGIPGKTLVRLAMLAIPVMILAVAGESYRLGRIKTFLDPSLDPKGIGWQINNSYYAIADGGWLGQGLGHSIEKFLYLPEGQTDFIFAIVVEEIGILGACVILILFAVLIYKGFEIALRSREPMGKLIAIGITTMIGFSVFVNVATVTGLMPATGIPLPFISYGGTSLILKMWSAGVLLNISRYTDEIKAPAGK